MSCKMQLPFIFRITTDTIINQLKYYYVNEFSYKFNYSHFGVSFVFPYENFI